MSKKLDRYLHSQNHEVLYQIIRVLYYEGLEGHKYIKKQSDEFDKMFAPFEVKEG